MPTLFLREEVAFQVWFPSLITRDSNSKSKEETGGEKSQKIIFYRL